MVRMGIHNKTQEDFKSKPSAMLCLLCKSDHKVFNTLSQCPALLVMTLPEALLPNSVCGHPSGGVMRASVCWQFGY